MYGTGPTYEEYKRDLEVARNGHEQAARERIIVTLGLLLECSTVRAQKKVQHRIQTFSVQELFRDQDDAGCLNQSSVNRRRSEIQDDPNSGITTIGTLPAWVFPSFAAAALEPSFGEHFDIIGVKVPEARLQCIPALDSEEYRRLIEVRNQMWETIIRGQRVQPSDIRTRMQTEIESRNGLVADYYDQLAEQLDSRRINT